MTSRILLAIFACGFVTSVHADAIVVEFEGIVSRIYGDICSGCDEFNDGRLQGYDVGDVLRGFYIIDPTSSSIPPDPIKKVVFLGTPREGTDSFVLTSNPFASDISIYIRDDYNGPYYTGDSYNYFIRAPGDLDYFDIWAQTSDSRGLTGLSYADLPNMQYFYKPYNSIVAPDPRDPTAMLEEVVLTYEFLGKFLQVYDFTLSARRIPEPGTLALLGIGLFGMGLSRRRKV